LHYSFYSKQEHERQIERYSTIAAQDLYKQNKEANFYNCYVKPINRFLTDYIFKRGFLDGKAGLAVCMYAAKAMHLKYVKLKGLLNQ